MHAGQYLLPRLQLSYRCMYLLFHWLQTQQWRMCFEYCYQFRYQLQDIRCKWTLCWVLQRIFCQSGKMRKTQSFVRHFQSPNRSLPHMLPRLHTFKWWLCFGCSRRHQLQGVRRQRKKTMQNLLWSILCQARCMHKIQRFMQDKQSNYWGLSWLLPRLQFGFWRLCDCSTSYNCKFRHLLYQVERQCMPDMFIRIFLQSIIRKMPANRPIV